MAETLKTKQIMKIPVKIHILELTSPAFGNLLDFLSELSSSVSS